MELQIPIEISSVQKIIKPIKINQITHFPKSFGGNKKKLKFFLLWGVKQGAIVGFRPILREI